MRLFAMKDVFLLKYTRLLKKRTECKKIFSKPEQTFCFYQMIVDFLNSIFSFFTEPGILPLT